MDSFYSELYKNKDAWYSMTKKYWEDTDSSSKGMLGGYTHVNNTDIITSREILSDLIKKKFFVPKNVIEYGAGIGRVSENLLVEYFNDIVVLEQNENFLKKAEENLSKLKLENTKLRFIPASMQAFASNPQKYGIESTEKFSAIWIQWCVENLDDTDLVSLLIRSKELLDDKGMIFVKENVVEDFQEIKINDIDYSRVRNDALFKEIFKKSGLKIFKHLRHPNWPKDLMEVSIFILMK